MDIENEIKIFYEANPIDLNVIASLNGNLKNKKVIPFELKQENEIATFIVRGLLKGTPFLTPSGNYKLESNDDGYVDNLLKSTLSVQLSEQFQPEHVLEDLRSVFRKVNTDIKNLESSSTLNLGEYINCATNLDLLKIKNKVIELGWKARTIETHLGLLKNTSIKTEQIDDLLSQTDYEMRSALFPSKIEINSQNQPILLDPTFEFQAGDFVELDFTLLSFKGAGTYGIQAFLRQIVLIERNNSRSEPISKSTQLTPPKKLRFALPKTMTHVENYSLIMGELQNSEDEREGLKRMFAECNEQVCDNNNV